MTCRHLCHWETEIEKCLKQRLTRSLQKVKDKWKWLELNPTSALNSILPLRFFKIESFQCNATFWFCAPKFKLFCVFEFLNFPAIFLLFTKFVYKILKLAKTLTKIDIFGSKIQTFLRFWIFPRFFKCLQSLFRNFSV